MKKIEVVDIYPLTIFKDRYGGTYSGGRWIAFNLDHVPNGALGGDFASSQFFSNTTHIFGVGDTPDNAICDLSSKLKYKLDQNEWRELFELFLDSHPELKPHIVHILRGFFNPEQGLSPAYIRQIIDQRGGPNYEYNSLALVEKIIGDNLALAATSESEAIRLWAQKIGKRKDFCNE